MSVERNPVASGVEDDLLAAEIHDAVWMGEDEPEISSSSRAPSDSATEKHAETPPRDSNASREK